jgi:3-dehydroquinate dehydratase-2
MHMKKILVIHGPNLNLLGVRQPEIYGHLTLADINGEIERLANGLQVTVKFFQSNHEGYIVDFLHDQRDWADGVLINPGALAHYSYSLRDAIAAIRLPTVEVHLSDIYSREPFRKISVIREVCLDQVSGRGLSSYLDGLRILVTNLGG